MSRPGSQTASDTFQESRNVCIKNPGSPPFGTDCKQGSMSWPRRASVALWTKSWRKEQVKGSTSQRSRPSPLPLVSHWPIPWPFTGPSRGRSRSILHADYWYIPATGWGTDLSWSANKAPTNGRGSLIPSEQGQETQLISQGWPSTLHHHSSPSKAGYTRQECTNINCTPFLSKVFETCGLQKGDTRGHDLVWGIKGCSFDHLHVDLLDSVLRPLESGSPSLLLSINFVKNH